MFWNTLRRLTREDTGTAAVEYGIIAMLIAVALAGTMFSLGEEVETQYDTISTQYAEAANGNTGSSE